MPNGSDGEKIKRHQIIVWAQKEFALCIAGSPYASCRRNFSLHTASILAMSGPTGIFASVQGNRRRISFSIEHPPVKHDGF